MIDARTQSPFQASAEFMRAWTLVANLSAIQTMTFWTRMLRSPLASPLPTTEPSVCESAAVTMPEQMIPNTGTATDHVTEQPASPETPADPGYSSYRSSGGHAVAQMIVAEG